MVSIGSRRAKKFRLGPEAEMELARDGLLEGVMRSSPGGGIGGGISTPDYAPVPMDERPLTNSGISIKPRNGIFDRMGDFISSDEGRAALLRSGAATLQGGLGAGIQAGTQFVDQRRAQAEDRQRFDILTALKERGVDIDEFQAQSRDALGWGGLGVEAGQLEETGRHNRATEGLTARGQDVDKYGIDTGASVQVRGQDVNRANNTDDNSTQRYGIDKRYAADIYGSNMGYRSAVDGRTAAGIASNQPTRKIVTKTPGQPEYDHWGPGVTPAVPEVTETIEAPIAAPQAPPPEAVQALRDNPGLKAEFEAMYGPGSAAQYLGGR